MKNLVVLFLLFSTFAVVAQDDTTNAKPQWIIGFGANIIDGIICQLFQELALKE
jgi:hypothetical protein